MALQRSGGFLKSGGYTAAIGRQLKLINLKPIKKISIKYDPFDENVRHIREFNSLILSKQAVRTNLSCIVKTDITSDRSPPELTFNLVNGHIYNFKCQHLTSLDIFLLINKHITPLAPTEEPEKIETKVEKKGKKKK